MIELAENDDERRILFRFMAHSFLSAWPRSRRVSGDIICRWCGLDYYHHPIDKDFPFLVVACGGDRLKL